MNISDTKLYKTFVRIKCRCYNIKDKRYKDYGGRGITVCDEWRNSFEQFAKDMGEPPTKKHSIDRIDNNKGYSKENCRWATPKQQANNTRLTTFITYKNETKSLSEWTKISKLRKGTIITRLRRGWTIEKALFTKIDKVKYFSYKGEKKTISQWSKLYNISPQALRFRINNWPKSKVLTQKLEVYKVSKL